MIAGSGSIGTVQIGIGQGPVAANAAGANYANGIEAHTIGNVTVGTNAAFAPADNIIDSNLSNAIDAGDVRVRVL